MKIQSLSIVVPTNGCVNDCPFCVSKMHAHINNDNSNITDESITKRLKYAQLNGITTCIITGTGEPLQNRDYLLKIARIFSNMDHPFPNVELQTTGVLLNKMVNMEYINIKLLNLLGVNTISLSVSSFNNISNNGIIKIPDKEKFILKDRIQWLKSKGFNIRLSLNLSNAFDKLTPLQMFNYAKALGADQITFRELWYDDLNPTDASKWVIENALNESKVDDIKKFIIDNGNFLYKLPYGLKVYSVDGISTVIDEDCMSKENTQDLKYIILQSDGRLYSRWDDEGSLIF